MTLNNDWQSSSQHPQYCLFCFDLGGGGGVKFFSTIGTVKRNCLTSLDQAMHIGDRQHLARAMASSFLIQIIVFAACLQKTGGHSGYNLHATGGHSGNCNFVCDWPPVVYNFCTRQRPAQCKTTSFLKARCKNNYLNKKNKDAVRLPLQPTTPH